MVAEPRRPLISVEEYLEIEENSTIKHEYIDGHVYAMAGGRQRNSAIATTIIAALWPHLRGGPCRVRDSDLKIRLGPKRFVYPDVSVTRDPRDLADPRALFIQHPRIIVEVLSDSTEEYDRTDKFDMYREVPEMQEYVLVTPDRMLVEVYARAAAAPWPRTPHRYGPGDDVVLSSIDFRVPMATIYEDVELTPG